MKDRIKLESGYEVRLDKWEVPSIFMGYAVTVLVEEGSLVWGQSLHSTLKTAHKQFRSHVRQYA